MKLKSVTVKAFLLFFLINSCSTDEELDTVNSIYEMQNTSTTNLTLGENKPEILFENFQTEQNDLSNFDVSKNLDSSITNNINSGIVPRPVIWDTGTGCDDHTCIWITGVFNSPTATTVELRKSGDDREIIGYHTYGQFHYVNKNLITLQLSDYEMYYLIRNGLRIFVTDNESYSWSTYGNYNVTHRYD